MTQKCRCGNYIIEEIEVDLVVVVQVWQVGAHFKALVKLESLVPLDLPCIFLCPKQGLLHIASDLKEVNFSTQLSILSWSHIYEKA